MAEFTVTLDVFPDLDEGGFVPSHEGAVLAAVQLLELMALNGGLGKLIYRTKENATGLTAQIDLGDPSQSTRECLEGCGEELPYESAMMTCEECGSKEKCGYCGELNDPEDLTEKLRFCSSCVHNARRSGFDGEL
ncbi:hypothetical protein ACFVAJ_17150 [Agromyces sp. NPDC057679]|uniref:hypothetical protein n=1 Tax=Agromyces sp. NPDC057679 TaxID=3346207 RepID=UPI0036724814